MLAIIRNAQKMILPRYSETTKQNESTLMVVVDVDFVCDDTGKVHHQQSYSHRPEEVDQGYYQKQADAMQADVDHARAVSEERAVMAEQHAVADKQIETLLNNPFKKTLSIGDKIPLNDAGGQS